MQSVQRASVAEKKQDGAFEQWPWSCVLKHLEDGVGYDEVWLSL